MRTALITPLVPPVLMNVARRIKRKLTVAVRIRGLTTPRHGFLHVRLMGLEWRLDVQSCISRSLIETGIWEPNTTKVIEDLVKPGMKVLAVGANFGYYAMLMAKQVGPSGHIWAFEPTTRFREQLQWHVNANAFGDRVTVVPYGLSDSAKEMTIDLTPQSASMHYAPSVARTGSEVIQLRTLDSAVADLQLDRVDFVSMDIDGHEAAFLRGGKEVLTRNLPPIAMEFAQRCLYFAGSDVREVAGLLKEIGYEICSEETRSPFRDELEFLTVCGNYNSDSNALALPRALKGRTFRGA